MNELGLFPIVLLLQSVWYLPQYIKPRRLWAYLRIFGLHWPKTQVGKVQNFS